VGFDPPPLEPDRRRLAGDLSKIRIPVVETAADPVLAERELRAGLAVLQRLGAGGDTAPEDLLVLEATGEALGRLAVDNPARLLEPLRSLRLTISSLQDGGPPCADCLATAEAGVWLALPEAPPWAVRPRGRPSALGERFLRLLDRPQ
jgi:hypothetical protein